MTHSRQFGKRIRKGRPFPGQLLLGWFSLFCLLLLFKNQQLASESVRQGLLLCAKTVIPSLFPFTVLSELLIRGGFGERLVSRICAPLSRFISLPTAGVTAMLLGLLCGFPVGAKAVTEAYRLGRLSKRDAERSLCLAGTPSSAFVIGTVGSSLWGNTRFGTMLYLSVIISALLWAMLDGLLERKRTEIKIDSVPPKIIMEPQKGAVLFTESVRASCGTMLIICAYVIFFSALTGALDAILADLGVPQIISSAILSTVELSRGVSLAAALESPLYGAILSAFACGWSGISIHCQVISVCDGTQLSLRRYLAAKLFQAVLCAVIFATLLALLPSLLGPSATV